MQIGKGSMGLRPFRPLNHGLDMKRARAQTELPKREEMPRKFHRSVVAGGPAARREVCARIPRRQRPGAGSARADAAGAAQLKSDQGRRGGAEAGQGAGGQGVEGLLEAVRCTASLRACQRDVTAWLRLEHGGAASTQQDKMQWHRGNITDC